MVEPNDIRNSAGLCGHCTHALVRQTRRGTAYLRCALVAADSRYPKYPRLPVSRCDGYEHEEDTVQPVTHVLHRLTDNDPDREWTLPNPDPRIRQDVTVINRDKRTWYYKRYFDDLPGIELPRELPTTSASTVEVLAGTAEVETAELSLEQLARILFLSCGIARTMERNFGTMPFRTAGSAGGRFPMEFYAVVPDGGSVPAGVHWYDPMDHRLVTVGPPPTGESPALVVTGVPWRTGWQYRERGYRHIYWDTGTALSQTLAAAASAGVPAALYSVFPDALVAEMVGADGVHEFPVALVSLGARPPALQPSGPAARGQVDETPIEFPLVTAAQRAGNAGELGAPWPTGASVTVPEPPGEPVDATILRRGSQRLMEPDGRLPRRLLEIATSVALRGIDIPHWVAVNSVDGLDRGLYRWPDLDRPLRAGDLRDDLYHVCMEQDLGRDAAFDVIAAIDLTGLDDHDYRDAQLAAGLVEGRLHLLAYAYGASACGMTFYDRSIPEFLGEPVEGLIITCVGVPSYRSRPGGPPGRPNSVRLIQPRTG